MKAKLVMSLALLVLSLPTCASMAATPAAKAAPAKRALSTQYAMTAGDILALTSTNMLNAMKLVDVPLMVSFDGEGKKLEVAIFGTRSSVDGLGGAKATIEDFLKTGMPVINTLAEQMGLELTESQVTILYMNRNDSFKQVVRRENGVYVMD